MGLKTKIIISVATVMLALIWLQALRINKLTEERDRFESNTSALLSAVTMWRTKDSLNVAKAEVLSLRLAEMERYRAEDLKTIESLRIRKRDLEQITTIQSKTIAELRGKVSDTIVVYREILRDTMQTLHISDKWVDLHGIINSGSFDGTLEVRDSLIIVESVERERFLGFLWHTKRIKKRFVDVTNKNPYTTIVGVESIQIDN
jgi:hypothetical protein